MHVQMKSLKNERERRELLDRLNRLRMDSQGQWGSMSAHQMIRHLSDSFRVALGEESVSQSSPLFKRTIYKWAALWVPVPWPHSIKTRPEMDQKHGGTKPTEFAADIETFRALFDRFCGWTGNLLTMAGWGTCRGLSGCGTLTFISITTSGNLVA